MDWCQVSKVILRISLRASGERGDLGSAGELVILRTWSVSLAVAARTVFVNAERTLKAQSTHFLGMRIAQYCDGSVPRS